MAISSLLPRKAMPSRSRAQSLKDRHDYDQNPEKTEGGWLVSSYQCTPETAAQEFEISKQLYHQLTGRSQPKRRDVIMYRIIQSFKPGEISPEEANQIGYELAMKFTKGRHAFVVSTHTDKVHIHSHIEFNSTNLDCDGKFENVKDSAFVLRRLNDELCAAHGLSVIKNPKKRAKLPGEAAAVKYGVSFKERLRQVIDRVLPNCKSYEDFLARMRSEGYEIKEDKNLSFRAPGQEYFTRSKRLGDDYTKEALMERSGGTRGRMPAKKTADFARRGNVNLLIDIQKKMEAGKGKGYERWAKIFNLKEAAKTLNFLVDNGLTDYDGLLERAEEIRVKFEETSARMKQLEGRMAQTAQMKTHIINYSKTREVYAVYKKARNKGKFRAEHRAEIEKHEAAKRAFDALGGKAIPKVAQLTEEYGRLLEEKQDQYEKYRSLKKEMLEYQTIRQNVDRILEMPEPEKMRDKEQQTR